MHKTTDNWTDRSITLLVDIQATVESRRQRVKIPGQTVSNNDNKLSQRISIKVEPLRTTHWLIPYLNGTQKPLSVQPSVADDGLSVFLISASVI